MMIIIYRRLVVMCAGRAFEQFSATIVNELGEFQAQKIMWSQVSVRVWAQRRAGLNGMLYREIDYESVFKPKKKVRVA